MRAGGPRRRNRSARLLQSVAAYPLSRTWLGIASAGYERREYHERLVPATQQTERYHLYTLAALLLWLPSDHLKWRGSVIYRYQDSTDPRLDFTDWIHELGARVRF